jgi:hypothetical protein
VCCDKCRELEEEDDWTPDCEVYGAECKLIPLSYEEKKALDIWNALNSIGRIVGPETVFARYGNITAEIFDLILVIADELEIINEASQPQGG